VRILIADDDRLSAAALARTLTPDRFEVTVVDNGASALEILRQPDAPSMAILDWMMPQVHGPEVCRTIRAETPHADRYLILLTGRNAREDVVAGLEAGADDYLVKPFHRDELLARVSVGERVLSLQAGLKQRVDELQLALSKVKQLQGLLPICSYCKSIRSDENYWQQVDSYLVQHSQAQFTHGVCPSCYETLSRELEEYAKNKPPTPRISM
jgi:DNA-binding response OmpR family regulator